MPSKYLRGRSVVSGIATCLIHMSKSKVSEGECKDRETKLWSWFMMYSTLSSFEPYTSLTSLPRYPPLYHNPITSSSSPPDDDMLQEVGVFTGQVVILEVKNDNGTWPIWTM